MCMLLFITPGVTIAATATMTVGCKTMHTTMVAASIAAAAEAGIQTANPHHGIIMLATAKVRETQKKKNKKLHTTS